MLLSWDFESLDILHWRICLIAPFHQTFGCDSLVFSVLVTLRSLLHSAKLVLLHNGALHVTNSPEWVVGAIWSNGSVEI